MHKQIKPLRSDLDNEVEVIQGIEVFIGDYLRHGGDIGGLQAGDGDGDFDRPDFGGGLTGGLRKSKKDHPE